MQEAHAEWMASTAVGEELPGELLAKHAWDEPGDGCWDCLRSLERAGVPVYHLPDVTTDVASTMQRERLESLVLEVRTVDGARVGFLRPARDSEQWSRVAPLDDLDELLPRFNPRWHEPLPKEPHGW